MADSKQKDERWKRPEKVDLTAKAIGTTSKMVRVGKSSVDTAKRISSNKWTFPSKSNMSKSSTIAGKGGAAVGMAGAAGVLACDIMGQFMRENEVDVGKPINEDIVKAITEVGEKRISYKRALDKLITFYSTSKRVDLPGNTYLTWKQTREKSIRELRTTANDIDKHHKNVNITTLTTASVGTVAGTVTLAAILAPFTFGASVAVGAAALGATAGLTALGASLTELGLTKSAFKTAQEYINADQKLTQELYKLIDELTECEEELKVSMSKLDKWDNLEIVRTVFVCIGGAGSIATSSISIGRGATLMLSSGVRGLVQEMAHVPKAQWAAKFGTYGRSFSAAKGIAKQAPSLASKGARVFGGVLTGIGVVLDVYSLVTTAIDVHKGSVSAAGDSLRSTARILEEERQQVIKLIEELKKQQQSEEFADEE